MVEHQNGKKSIRQKRLLRKRVQDDSEQSVPLQLKLKPESVKVAFDYNLVSLDVKITENKESSSRSSVARSTKTPPSRHRQKKKPIISPSSQEKSYDNFSETKHVYNNNFDSDEESENEADNSALLNRSTNLVTPPNNKIKLRAKTKAFSSHSHKPTHATKKQWTKMGSHFQTSSNQSTSGTAFSRSVMKKIPSPRKGIDKRKVSSPVHGESYKPLISSDDFKSSSLINKYDNIIDTGNINLFDKEDDPSCDYDDEEDTSISSLPTLSQATSSQANLDSISELTSTHLFSSKGDSNSQSEYGSKSATNPKQESEHESKHFEISKSKSRLKGGPVDVDEGDFVDIGTHYDNIHTMAATYLKQKQYNDALEVFTRLLQSEIKEYGDINKMTASTWHNIGVVYSKYSLHITTMTNKQRRLDEEIDAISELESNASTIAGLAINAFDHAKDIYSRVFGSQHPKVANSLVKLGYEYLSIKSYDKALAAFQEALRIRSHCFEQNHILIAKVRNNIAISFLHLEKVEEAKEQLETAIETLRCVLTDLYNDKNCVTKFGVIAPSEPDLSMLSENVTINKEEVLHERALEVRLEVANLQSNLGCILLDLALKRKREKKSRKKEKLVVCNATTINFVIEINDNNEYDPESLKSVISDLAEAEASLSEALSIRLSICGENHHLIKSTRKKFELARSLLRKHICKEQKKEKYVDKSHLIGSQTYQNRHNLTHHQERESTQTSTENTAQDQGKHVGEKKSNQSQYINNYLIQTITNFESSRNPLDEPNLCEDDRNVIVETEEGSGVLLKKAIFYVKTLEDGEYDYDSDDSFDEYLEDDDYLSDWLSNPENNIGALNAMASSLAQQKQYEKSVKVLAAVRDCHLKTHGELHHLFGTCVHNLGIVHLRAGHYKDALVAFEKALKVRKEVLGENHMDVALSLVKVGITHLILREFSFSLKAFDDALNIRRLVMGDLHPSVALVYNNIACVHVACYHLVDARSAYERAVTVQRSALVYEPDNRSLSLGAAITLTNLGHVLASMNSFDSSGIMLREAFLIRQSVLDSKQSIVLSSIDALANLCIVGNKNYAGALRWYNVLLARLKVKRTHYDDKILKAAHRKAIVYYKIGRVHLMQNDIESALQSMKDGAQILRHIDNADLKDNCLSLKMLIDAEMNLLEKKMNAGADSLFWI